MKRASIAIIINDDNKILVGLRKDNKKLGPPGGKIEYNETPLNAMKRELKEETSLEFGNEDIEDKLKVYHFFTKEKWEIFAYFIQFKDFKDKSKIVNTEPEKTEDWKWMDVENIKQTEHVCSLDDVFKYL
jgi:mutator protein MutT